MKRRKFLELLGLGALGLFVANTAEAKPVGPKCYYTGSEYLTPPDLTGDVYLNPRHPKNWKVARGFPSKHYSNDR